MYASLARYADRLWARLRLQGKLLQAGRRQILGLGAAFDCTVIKKQRRLRGCQTADVDQTSAEDVLSVAYIPKMAMLRLTLSDLARTFATDGSRLALVAMQTGLRVRHP